MALATTHSSFLKAQSPRRLAASVVEAALWTFAILSLGYVSMMTISRKSASVRLGSELSALRAQRPSDLTTQGQVPLARILAPIGQSADRHPAIEVARPAEGELFGRVLVDRLGIDAMIVEGSRPEQLDVAVGHMSDSAAPGSNGRVVLTAHRDTFFRPLRHVRTGDEIVIQTPYADHRYQVVATDVVSPRDLGVLMPTTRRELALITCYPFNYVGPAPLRFVVYAREELAPGI